MGGAILQSKVSKKDVGAAKTADECPLCVVLSSCDAVVCRQSHQWSAVVGQVVILY